MTVRKYPLSKTLLATLTAAGLMTATAAMADHYDHEACDMHSPEGMQKMADEMAKRHTERQTKLHEALKLSPAQESAWTKYAAATQPPKVLVAKSPEKDLSTPAKMEQVLERQKERQTLLQQHLQATKSFYSELSPEQKKIFDEFHQPRPRQERDERRPEGRPHHGPEAPHDMKPQR